MSDSSIQSRGVFYGVGVGPGDLELMTMKAVRLIQQCDLVTYLSSDNGKRVMVSGFLNPTHNNR